MEWYLKVMRDNYANFNGRARRKEYWMYTLILTVLLIALMAIMFSALALSDETRIETGPSGYLTVHEILKIGPGLDKKSEMGPLITKEHLDKVKGYVDIGKKELVKVVCGGPNAKNYGKNQVIGKNLVQICILQQLQMRKFLQLNP